MARNFPADTRGQRALEELYEKELRTQLVWFLKSEKAKKDNPGKVISPAAIVDTPTPKIEDVLPAHMVEKIRQIRQEERKFGKKSNTSTTLMPVVSADSLDEPVPDMVPPDRTTQMILYDGISKEGRGR
ncbi:unnamed protein product [Echinostoma caproni]|uniref:RNA polymerase II-associated protein 3-like n=1 Tax=Echinostoma caproni TaxID=27848 RepID=A0A183B5K0_9TREM|nr:unnamed protein product [Echinostoma caproni]